MNLSAESADDAGSQFAGCHNAHLLAEHGAAACFEGVETPW